MNQTKNDRECEGCGRELAENERQVCTPCVKKQWFEDKNAREEAKKAILRSMFR